jgi:hypothetical protein
MEEMELLHEHADEYQPEISIYTVRLQTHSRGVSDSLHVRPELDLWVPLTSGGCQIGPVTRTIPAAIE